MQLSKLAEIVKGQLIGDGETEISSAATLQNAQNGQISYLALHSYREQALKTKASAIIVVGKIEELKCDQIICNDPHLAFAKVMRALYPAKKEVAEISKESITKNANLAEQVTIYPFVYLGKNVSIGKNSTIYPHTFIGDNVQIGDDCLIHSHVSIRENSVIGNRVIIQNGCRIGSDGYGFAKNEQGQHLKIPQVGKVVIGDDVEIGANCCIDRSTLSKTKIGNGTKLDNLVQVGHNVEVGENCLLISQVGIAGSSKIGNNVTLAGQVGVSGHLTIGDNTTVGGKSGVTKDIPADEVYVGYPAIPYKFWIKLQHMYNKMLKDFLNPDKEQDK